MLSWLQAQALARNEGEITRDEPDWLALALPLGMEPQVIVLKRMEVWGERGIILAAPVCPDSGIRPLDALLYCGAAPVGGLALEKGVYILRQTFPFAALTAELLRETMWRMGREAARLRAATARFGSAAGPFEHFAA